MFQKPVTFSLKEQDFLGIMIVLILIFLGGVMVNSATEGTQLQNYATRESIYIILAILVFCLTLYIPYTIWIEYGYIFYIIFLFVLFLMPFMGKSVAGSKSWFSIGGWSFQPSELMKAFTILASASYIRDQELDSFTLRDFAILSGIVLLPMALIMAEPDFGTAVTFISILFAILFFSDLKLKEILKWSTIGVCIALILFGIAWFSFFKPYQKERILTFLDPQRDPKKSGYQINQAKIAVGSGKVFGKGLHSGTQNRLKFLPAPHTDFIVAVVGEELGFVGVASLCFLFLILLSKFLTVAETTTTREGSFVALSVFFLFLFHTIVNIAMVLGLFPIMGIPIPFLSFGGTFLLTTSFLSGLVLNISSRHFLK